MKKIILTAAVSAALLFALAAGTAGVPSVQEPSTGARQHPSPGWLAALH